MKPFRLPGETCSKERSRKMKRFLIASLNILLIVGWVGWNNGLQAAEEYPVKPITVIIPLEPGADGDVIMRPVIQRASEVLGKPMVVVNKPGGGNTLGHREIHNAKPDGYTIGILVTAIAWSKIRGLVPFDYRDFTLIGLTYAGFPVIYSAVKTPKPFKTMQEVMTQAKAHPGEISMATTAVGGAYWVAANAVQEASGTKFNLVPQEGSGGLVATAVAGGHTDLGISGFSAVKSQLDAENVRLLTVVSDKKLTGKYSDVPTMKELGYDVALGTFTGVMGPKNMPKAATEKLVKAFEIASTDPKIVAHIHARYGDAYYLAPEPFLQFLDKQREIYRKVLGKAGLLKEK
jgi:tripartite-type tricarboxylate transporter receptor subunit TctC